MINFRKISAIASSALMVGMTMGVATAANYPAPFVSGGVADVAVVYGTGSGVSVLDAVEAGNIQTNLQSFMGASTSGSTTSTSGETVALDTSSTRIWLNTSLNTAKSTLTKSDLPTTLADYTFEGDVSSKLTSTIKLLAGAAAGGDNSGKIIFSKQPKSSDDPTIGISLGSSATSNPMYNASATMSAINFSHADSEGEEITLFGQKFTVSSDTSSTSIVLLKEAQKVSLDTDNPSATVTIEGAEWTVELVSASDTAATVKVTDSAGTSDSKEISEANSKKVNGLTIAVQTADETNQKLSATVIAGAKKLTLTHGQKVTEGDNADPVDGTQVFLPGTPTATTEIAIAVFRPDSSNDAILPGESFVDPVFGSFKLDFAGLSSPLDDATRETITVANSGDDSMSLTMTDSNSNLKTFDFAHNASAGWLGGYQNINVNGNSGDWRLSDANNKSIWVYEMANVSEDEYIVLGNEDYGHLLKVFQIANNTGTDYTKDQVKLEDVFSGEIYTSTFTAEETGTISVDGKQYTVTFHGDGDSGRAQFKYPTSDSANANTFVMYPTIETSSGANLALYEPLNISLEGFNTVGVTGGNDVAKLQFPDGDGYTGISISYTGGATTASTWTINGALIGTNQTSNYTTGTIGQLTYNFTSSGFPNRTVIYLTNLEDDTTNLVNPGVLVFEGKDNNNAYEAVFVDLEGNAASMGTSTNGVGVNDVLFSTGYGHYEGTRSSDSDFTEDVDWYGVHTIKDASDSDQKTISLTVPKAQVYANLFIGAADSSVSSSASAGSTTSLGDVLVTDSEVSSVSSKNLIVVGGSCINAAAATLVGGAYCGSAWTDATGVGSGQFLIKSYSGAYTSGKIALLVAGYNAEDTVNAAKYLRTQTVDTSAEYKGTSATSAELVTETA